jgi:hypothetical protein
MRKKGVPIVLIVILLASFALAYNSGMDPSYLGHSSGELNLTPLYVNSTTQNVGINNSNPSYSLDVTGNARLNGVDSTFLLRDSDSSLADNQLGMGTRDNKLYFWDADVAPWRYIMVLDMLNLRVGIGTSNPTEALDVVGNIKSTGTICDVNGCIGYNSSTVSPLPATCSNNAVLKWNSTSSAWECGADDNSGNGTVSSGNGSSGWDDLQIIQGAPDFAPTVTALINTWPGTTGFAYVDSTLNTDLEIGEFPIQVPATMKKTHVFISWASVIVADFHEDSGHADIFIDWDEQNIKGVFLHASSDTDFTGYWNITNAVSGTVYTVVGPYAQLKSSIVIDFENKTIERLPMMYTNRKAAPMYATVMSYSGSSGTSTSTAASWESGWIPWNKMAGETLTHNLNIDPKDCSVDVWLGAQSNGWTQNNTNATDGTFYFPQRINANEIGTPDYVTGPKVVKETTNDLVLFHGKWLVAHDASDAVNGAGDYHGTGVGSLDVAGLTPYVNVVYSCGGGTSSGNGTGGVIETDEVISTTKVASKMVTLTDTSTVIIAGHGRSRIDVVVAPPDVVQLFVSVRIDGVLCARNQEAAYVSAMNTFESTTCIKELAAGTYNLSVELTNTTSSPVLGAPYNATMQYTVLGNTGGTSSTSSTPLTGLTFVPYNQIAYSKSDASGVSGVLTFEGVLNLTNVPTNARYVLLESRCNVNFDVGSSTINMYAGKYGGAEGLGGSIVYCEGGANGGHVNEESNTAIAIVELDNSQNDKVLYQVNKSMDVAPGKIDYTFSYKVHGYYIQENGSGTSSSFSCPDSSWTMIESNGNQLGCMQNDEEGSADWKTALQSCWENQSARLPTFNELYVAFNNFNLTNDEDNNEWTNNIFWNSAHAAYLLNGITPAGLGITNVEAYRCFIPASGGSGSSSLPITCSDGAVLKWNATSSAWGCAPDIAIASNGSCTYCESCGGDYPAEQGKRLAVNSFNKWSGYAASCGGSYNEYGWPDTTPFGTYYLCCGGTGSSSLPTCSPNEIIRRNVADDDWECVADINRVSTCPGTQKMIGLNVDGTPNCAADVDTDTTNIGDITGVTAGGGSSGAITIALASPAGILVASGKSDHNDYVNLEATYGFDRAKPWHVVVGGLNIPSHANAGVLKGYVVDYTKSADNRGFTMSAIRYKSLVGSKSGSATWLAIQP